jgi:hypothetical protein
LRDITNETTNATVTIATVSPRSKRRQRNYEKVIILLATQEVLKSNAGNVANYGSMPKVLTHYHGIGHDFLTRGRVQSFFFLH